jgi:hypothetical protein
VINPHELVNTFSCNLVCLCNLKSGEMSINYLSDDFGDLVLIQNSAIWLIGYAQETAKYFYGSV